MPAALAKQSFEPATSERLSGLLVEGKRYPRKLCGPGLYAEGEESRELSRSAMRGSAQFAQAADSVEVDQAGAGPAPERVILIAPSRTGSTLRRSHACPSSRVAAAAGSWKRPDHGRSGSGAS